MAKADRVSLTYEADIGPLIKKLKEVDDLTGAEVRKAVATLRKATKPLNKNASEAKRAAQQAAEGLREVGDNAGDTESALRAMSGVVGMVSPELETVINGVAEASGALEGATRAGKLFGVSLQSVMTIAGPVGAALAVLGAAYAVISHEADKAEEAQEKAATAADRAMASFGRLSESLRSTSERFAVFSGETQKAAQQLQKREAEINRQAKIGENAAKLRITQLEEQRAAYLANTRVGKDHEAGLRAIDNQLKVAREVLVAIEPRRAKAIQQERDMAFAAYEAAEAQKRQRVATNSQTEALARRTAAMAEARAETERDLSIIFEQVNQRQRLKALQEELEPRTSFEQTEARINEQLRERTLILDEHDLLMGRTAASEAARQQIVLDRNRQIAEVRAEQQQFLEDQRQRFHDAELSRISIEEQRRRQMLQNAGMALATFAGGVADASRFASDKMAEDNKEAARRMFAVSKAAAISQAIINGALAITQSLAQLGPIFGPIAAAGVAASTAAQIGIISAEEPSFNDTPGVMSLPSGGSARFAPGDMVVAGKDLSDMRRQLDRAEPRRQAPPVQVIGIPLYEGRTYERARRDAYRRPGADSRALSALRRQGQGGW